jgi:hypothetical protein
MPAGCGVKVKVFNLAHAGGCSCAVHPLREWIFLRDFNAFFS